MDYWEWPWGGKIRFWPISEKSKERIIAMLASYMRQIKKEPFEIEE